MLFLQALAPGVAGATCHEVIMLDAGASNVVKPARERECYALYQSEGALVGAESLPKADIGLRRAFFRWRLSIGPHPKSGD
jgi:hypothetical protein